MNPKKIITVLLFAMCTITVMPAFAGDPVAGTKTENTNQSRSQQITNRIIEIRDMDKSNLTSSEKRELRKELKSLKKESKPKRKNGIYLSLGAIIVIGVLLILLL